MEVVTLHLYALIPVTAAYFQVSLSHLRNKEAKIKAATPTPQNEHSRNPVNVSCANEACGLSKLF